jgi:hypothetical protein
MVVITACFIVLTLMILFFLGLRFLQNNINSPKFLKKFSGKAINIKEVAFIDPKNKIILFQCEETTYVGVISPQNSYFIPHFKHPSPIQEHVSE